MIGIQVVSLAGGSPPTPTTAWFGAAGGDIGRSAECTLPLPDPERHISRRHAVVTLRQGRYVLQSLSANVALVVDGVALEPGDEASLEAGMSITIGPYTLQVLDAPESVGVTQSPQPAPRSPVAPPSHAAVRAPAVPSPQATARPSTPAPQAGARPPAAATPPPAPLPQAEDEPAEVDFVVGDTGELVRAAAAAATETDWAQALQQGLGIAIGAGKPEQARQVGELLRAMTRGTLELLTARMVAKRELGAAATQLRTRENNPLKFSPDVDAALTHLLGPVERGFLQPRAAVNEAFDDLRAHQVALLAGMRAALDTVMSRFDPSALEQRLAPSGALENLIPANRRARLWSAYAEEYARIVGEIENDFDTLLGRAFLKAYQAQLQALSADRQRDDPGG
ncbi:MAG TPA: type VI secretion system-associated FHA domain protein TagH [Burkholderiaceae bacterium]|nr:type VI secretion system-associated FHA domain protein TagH [Burkholderiaceae bacterium]